MKLIMEWDGDQDRLGFDDNFDLVDSIIYMIDYGVAEPDGYVRDSHNGISLSLLRGENSQSSLSSSSPQPTAQECLENIGDLFDDFYRNAQEFFDKQKEKRNEQD